MCVPTCTHVPWLGTTLGVKYLYSVELYHQPLTRALIKNLGRSRRYLFPVSSCLFRNFETGSHS